MTINLTKVTTGFNTEANQNANMDAIEAEFEKVEYSDGSSTRTADLDMGGFNILNTAIPTNIQDAIDAATGAGNSGVTAGSYTNTNLTVDVSGRITAASSGVGGGASTASQGPITVLTVNSTISDPIKGLTYLMMSAGKLDIILGAETQVDGWSCYMIDGTTSTEYSLDSSNAAHTMTLVTAEGISSSVDPVDVPVGCTVRVEYSAGGYVADVLRSPAAAATVANPTIATISADTTITDTSMNTQYGVASATSVTITISDATKVDGWACRFFDVLGTVGINHTIDAGTDTIILQNTAGVISATSVTMSSGDTIELQYIGGNVYFGTVVRELTSVAGGTGLTAATAGKVTTVSLDSTAVSAGSYTTADITVDSQGRITSASSGSAGSTYTGEKGIAVAGTVVSLDSQTVHHSSNFTISANNWGIEHHIENAGIALGINAGTLTEGFNCSVVNTVANDASLTFTGFTGVFHRDAGTTTDVQATGLTIPANCKVEITLTANLISTGPDVYEKFLNITGVLAEAGGGGTTYTGGTGVTVAGAVVSLTSTPHAFITKTSDSADVTQLDQGVAAQMTLVTEAPIISGFSGGTDGSLTSTTATSYVASFEVSVTGSATTSGGIYIMWLYQNGAPVHAFNIAKDLLNSGDNNSRQLAVSCLVNVANNDTFSIWIMDEFDPLEWTSYAMSMKITHESW